MTRRQTLRILDANFNRSREGLRVCEEVARFVLETRALTQDLKNARHAVSQCLARTGVSFSELVDARDSKKDVGKNPETLKESLRGGALDLFAANIERVKEALRVLEEASKTFSPRLPAQFKKIRFSVYEIEKKIVPQLETLRDRRPLGFKKRRRS